ncbi:DUF4025 domain-containing protein [Salibacterium salarium]|uniref:DUF4025 domain-containing protein n=1 Tax=Salibacterium salarium TaxID=284579 RepID=A0A428MVN4_9BACI|nr:YozQ family protein [Salibacterium salarium]RSL30198.1 DUF4025 domain-containing protein [Salibacterium salarium]
MNKKRSTNADKTYNRDDYNSNDSASRGMADTHEQVSDTYTVGTIDDTKNSESRRKKR